MSCKLYQLIYLHPIDDQLFDRLNDECGYSKEEAIYQLFAQNILNDLTPRTILEPLFQQIIKHNCHTIFNHVRIEELLIRYCSKQAVMLYVRMLI